MEKICSEMSPEEGAYGAAVAALACSSLTFSRFVMITSIISWLLSGFVAPFSKSTT
jgi:hypothetical protein